MSNLKISALSSASTPLTGSEVVPLNQSGTTVKAIVTDFTNAIAITPTSITTTGTNSSSNTIGFQLTGAANQDYRFAIPGVADWRIRGNYASGNIDFVYIGTGTIFTVLSNGNLNMPLGNLVVGTAGKGINFTANTPASGMTSQNLTWYEEGTWTPVLSATTTAPTVSYANRTALYTRVGRLVTIHLWMNISSQSGGSGNVTITGLPFTSGNTGGAPVAAVTVGLYQNINPGVGLILTPYITNNSSVINLAGSTQTGSGWSNLTTTALGASNINLQLTATYLC